MKGAWIIFRRDLSRLKMNVVTLVVVVGLVAIPSFFAWFNISAVWDPFSNTKDLRFAVANSDEGFTSDLFPTKINVGEQVLSALRKNDRLDWVFTDQERAIEGTRSGQYYAAVVIPANFSKNMLTFFSTDTPRTKLIYYVNEKKNGLSPKIVGQGARQLSTQVNQIFIQTLSEVALSLVSGVNRVIEDPAQQHNIAQIAQRAQRISTRLNEAAATVDAFGGVASTASGLVDNTAQTLDKVAKAGKTGKSAVGSVRGAKTEFSQALEASKQALQTALNQTQTQLSQLGKTLDELFAQLDRAGSQGQDLLVDAAAATRKQAQSYRQIAQSLQQAAQNLPPEARDPITVFTNSIQTGATRLETAAQQLEQSALSLRQNTSQAQAQRREARAALERAQDAAKQMRQEFEHSFAKFFQQVQQHLGSMTTSLQDALGIIENTSQSNPTSNASGARGLTQDLAQAQQIFARASQALRETAQHFLDVHDHIDQAMISDDLEKLIRDLTDHPAVTAGFLASPVGVETHAVFPVGNFGSAMAPFYTVLALWVGSILLVVTIRSDISESELEQLRTEHHLKLRPSQAYIGRYGIFATIALVQATLVCTGNLWFIEVQSVHPWLYMLSGWVMALLFSFLIFTLVAALGNAGKAIAVFLLVLQISGAGGAFPLQILPQFFTRISPFLPATHGIDAMRDAIAGFAGNDYWLHLGRLALYILPVLFLGLVIRALLLNHNRAFVASLESTELI